MTEKEKSLYDLLLEKGFAIIRVWHEGNFSWHPHRGWYAEDEEYNIYHLGRDFTEAKGQIENNEITLL